MKKPTRTTPRTDPYSVEGLRARRAAQTPEARANVRRVLPGMASLADSAQSATDRAQPALNALNPMLRRQPRPAPKKR